MYIQWNCSYSVCLFFTSVREWITNKERVRTLYECCVWTLNVKECIFCTNISLSVSPSLSAVSRTAADLGVVGWMGKQIWADLGWGEEGWGQRLYLRRSADPVQHARDLLIYEFYLRCVLCRDHRQPRRPPPSRVRPSRGSSPSSARDLLIWGFHFWVL